MKFTLFFTLRERSQYCVLFPIWFCMTLYNHPALDAFISCSESDIVVSNIKACLAVLYKIADLKGTALIIIGFRKGDVSIPGSAEEQNGPSGDIGDLLRHAWIALGRRSAPR